MFAFRPLPRTLSAALRDCEDPKLAVRLSAVADLVRFADGEASDTERAVEGLCGRLEGDPEPQVRAAAAEALADARAPQGVSSLLRACDDPNVRVQQMALTALGEVSPKGEPRALSVAEARFASSHPGLRFAALLTLHHLRSQTSWPELTRALLDPDPKIRFLSTRLIDAAVDVDSELPVEIFDALVRGLRDVDLDTQVGCALVLVGRAHEARETIAGFVNSGRMLPEPRDQQQLLEACGVHRVREATPGLRRIAMAQTGARAAFGFYAKIALARMGDEAATRRLLRQLKSWSGTHRVEAAVACAEAGLSEAGPVIEQLGKQGRLPTEVAWDALERLKSAR